MAELLDIGRLAGERAADIAITGAPLGMMPIDLFQALAQIVAAKEPQTVFQYLNALEKVVLARQAAYPVAK